MSFNASLDEIVAENFNGLLSKAAHWRRYRLGDVATIKNGVPLPASLFNANLGTPVVRIRNVVDGATETMFNGPVEDSWFIEHGDLLIGMDGDFNAARWKGSRALLNQRVCMVAPKDGSVSVQFLSYVLPGYLAAVNKYTPSITVKHLSSKTVADLPIPVPPPTEQAELVAAIETHFSRLDAAVASLTRAKANVKRARASVLKAAVEGRLVPAEAEIARAEGREYEPASVLLERILVERRAAWAAWAAGGGRGKYVEPVKPETAGLAGLPEGWCWASLEQLGKGGRPFSYGVLVPGPDVSDGVPFVRVGDIGDGVVAPRPEKSIARSVADQFKRTYLEGGELLMSIVGTIGRVGVAPIGLKGANVARAVAVLPLSELASTPFVMHALRGPDAQARLVGASHEVARKTLNMEDLRAASVALPPIREQHRITTEVDRRLSVFDALDATLDTNLARCARLRQSILKRAFEGRLVPAKAPAPLLTAEPQVPLFVDKGA